MTTTDVELAALGLRYRYERERTPANHEDDWRRWLTTLFPAYIPGGPDSFADHHAEFWDWIWTLKLGEGAPAFVAIWPRGGAKSSSAELACCAVAAHKSRRYVLYVSSTRERADDHVGAVAAMLEQEDVGRAYPGLGERLLSKYGYSRGWRQNRLRTASGFTVDALGLDTAARGIKIESDRPDLIILDDIDDLEDSPQTIAKKIETLTKTILPAATLGASAVLAVQNIVHAEGIFARLAGIAEEPADFLADRIVSGPHPALRDMAYERTDEGRYRIVAGEPTWDVMGLAACQEEVDRIGMGAFLAECQHDMQHGRSGMFSHLDFQRCAWDDLPELERIAVWVDPAVSFTDTSDAQGIQADGLAADGTIYRLWSWEQRSTPQDALRRAILKAIELGGLSVGVETDQGGDTWISTYAEAARGLELGDLEPQQLPVFKSAKAGAGHGSKEHRWAQMLADYEKGRIVHVIGTHETLERALRRDHKPWDLRDASYWSWYDLRRPAPRRRPRTVYRPTFLSR